MLSGIQRFNWVVAGLACALSLGVAQAAPTVRIVHSSGSAQLKAVPTGGDGVQASELSPSFDVFLNRQDGPDAAGASAADARDRAALKQARKRLVNRSIARARGLGEAIAGEDRQGAGPGLLDSFDGLNFYDQRFANGGNQFSLEPPDQGLCVGNGFVLESVNDAIRVFDRHGKPVTGVVDLNSFYGYPAAIDRTTGVRGPEITDPTCYYDPQVNRFFHVVLTLDVNSKGALTGSNHLDLAVSSSGDPRNSWTIYRIPVQNDGTDGTPIHASCPCIGDYPHIGADENGIYLTTNEFPFFVNGFNAAQIYALSKRDLVRGAVDLTLVQIDTLDHLLDGNPGFTVWPAVSPSGDFSRANGGTEFFLSSLAVFTDDGNSNRIRVWALGNTRSLNTNSPDVDLVDSTVRVRHYGVPPDSEQKAGPTPLADCINDRSLAVAPGVFGCWHFLFGGATPPPLAVTPEMLASNDSRMQQVFYTGGRLYGALDTVVNVRGGQQAGIAYYAIRPYPQNGSVIGVVENEGKIGVAGNNVNYPAIAALPDGRGIIAFTLVGADHYPSAAYIRLGANGHEGAIKVAAAGKGPNDGFTGYVAYTGGTVARWGDYGAAALADGDFWIASEYNGQRCTLAEYVQTPFGTCHSTRGALGNWYTRISRVEP